MLAGGRCAQRRLAVAALAWCVWHTLKVWCALLFPEPMPRVMARRCLLALCPLHQRAAAAPLKRKFPGLKSALAGTPGLETLAAAFKASQSGCAHSPKLIGCACGGARQLALLLLGTPREATYPGLTGVQAADLGPVLPAAGKAATLFAPTGDPRPSGSAAGRCLP